MYVLEEDNVNYIQPFPLKRFLALMKLRTSVGKQFITFSEVFGFAVASTILHFSLTQESDATGSFLPCNRCECATKTRWLCGLMRSCRAFVVVYIFVAFIYVLPWVCKHSICQWNITEGGFRRRTRNFIHTVLSNEIN